MRDLTKIGKKINSSIGRAINDYDMIQEGDRILVAVSGGKDSMTLLALLKKIQSWAPVKFDLVAANIRTDFHCGGCVHKSSLTSVFEDMGIEYVFRDIKVLDEKGKTTCFWCSWNRRKALFDIAKEMNCGKIALGHHKDDIAETMLMNLLYNGEFSAINPSQELFNGEMAIIRPLCYVEEKTIIEFAAESGFSEQLCKCPFGADSRRKHVKKIIELTEKGTPGTNVKTNIFKSIERIKEDYINIKVADGSNTTGGSEWG